MLGAQGILTGKTVRDPSPEDIDEEGMSEESIDSQSDRCPAINETLETAGPLKVMFDTRS